MSLGGWNKDRDSRRDRKKDKRDKRDERIDKRREFKKTKPRPLVDITKNISKIIMWGVIGYALDYVLRFF